MTKRVSGLKLLAEDIRHRSWLIFMTLAGALLLQPFALQMELSSLEYGRADLLPEDLAWLAESKQNAAEAILGGGNTLILLGCFFTAVVAAVTGFSYLQSKKQVDFYHSLPVRRERLFFSRYLGGCLMTMIPYGAAVAASLFGVAGAHGVFCGELARTAAQGLSMFLLLFLVFYTLSILAMLLTGRILTGLLLTGFLNLYGVLCAGMAGRMMNYYFDNYYDPSSGNFGPEDFVSPVSLASKIGSRLKDGEAVSPGIWAFLWIAGALLLFLCVTAYRKRASEAAGNAFVWRWMEPVIKVAAVIPGALWVANLLQWIGYLSSPAMMILTVALAALLLNGIIEFIYSQDLKNIWRHKISGIAGLAGAVLLLLAFQGDWFGYDRWLPARDQVESMALYYWDGDGVFCQGSWSVSDRTRQALEGLTKNFEPLYEMAEDAAREPEEDSGQGLTQVILHYRMKNGMDAWRQYTVPVEEADGAMELLSRDPAFREKAYPLADRDTENVTDISFCDWKDLRGTYQAVNLERRELKEFLEIFRREEASFSYGELKEKTPLGTVMLDCLKECGYRNSSIEYYVYPEFSETLRFLEQKGIRLRQETDYGEILSIQAEYVTDVEVSGPVPAAEGMTAESSVSSYLSKIFLFEEQEEIQELFRHLVRIRQSDYLASREFVNLNILFRDGTYSYEEFGVRDPEEFQKFLEEHGQEFQ